MRFYKTLAYFGSLLVNQGVITIFPVTAHRREFRQKARESLQNLLEIYVCYSLDTSKKRSKKGIYQRANDERAESVPGIQKHYEEPLFPIAIVYIEVFTPQECTQKIIYRLIDIGAIP